MSTPSDSFKTRRRLLAGGASVIGAAWFGAPARAEAYPDHPLRLIVPFPAGGPTDIVARPVAQLLGEALGQQVVVDNRGGAGGSIGAGAVAKSPPDGYSLLIGTVGTHAINPALYPKLPYDAVADFTPLGLVASAPVAVVVPVASPWRSWADLVAAARAAPGRISFATAGNGTPGHLTGEMAARAAGIELQHVPYKGSAPALQDLLGGQVGLAFDPVQSVLPHVQNGRLRALSVSSIGRSHVLPLVPTLDESGLRGFEATAWWAVYAPAGLPGDVAQRLGRELGRIVAAKTFQDRLLTAGVQPAPATGLAGHAFTEFQRAEQAKWGKAVRDANVKLD